MFQRTLRKRCIDKIMNEASAGWELLLELLESGFENKAVAAVSEKLNQVEKTGNSRF